MDRTNGKIVYFLAYFLGGPMAAILGGAIGIEAAE